MDNHPQNKDTNELFELIASLDNNNDGIKLKKLFIELIEHNTHLLNEITKQYHRINILENQIKSIAKQ